MNETPETDVLLICMPFCDEYMPCMTYAMFKSMLLQKGMKSRVQHEYLYYASHIGKENYRRLLQVCTIGFGHDYFACETIFAKAAHDRTVKSFDEYLRWMESIHLPHKVFSGNQQEDTLQDLSIIKTARETANSYLDEAADRVMAAKPKLVAFTSMFQQHNAIIALAKKLKTFPDAPLILAGGPNCHGEAGSALIERIPAIDFVFTGEGDHIFADFCQSLLQDGTIPDESLPPGVLSRTKTHSLPAPVTMEMDDLPVPDFSDYFRERKLLYPEFTEKHVITAEGSRGCWWAAKHPCRFCGLNGCSAHLYREKSVKRFADELTQLSRKYPHARCFMTDNVISLKHMEELPDELLSRAEYRENMMELFCEIKSNAGSEDIKRLVSCGFTRMQAGIESFSDDILKLMNKGVSAIRQVETLKHCRTYNVSLIWYVLVGTPGETQDMISEVNRVISKIMHLEPPGTVAHVMFLRHSFYMEHPGENVPSLRPDRGYDFVYPDEDFIKRSAHLFAPAKDDELAKYYDYRRLGPAYEKLYELTETWIYHPQLLYMKDKGDMVKILDTRLIAKNIFRHLTGVLADIIRYCKTAAHEKNILSDLSEKYNEKEILDGLSVLTDEDLLLKIGDEYLTLAIDRDAQK